jgi:hypothetical protein
MTTISSDALVAAADGNPLVHIVVSDEGGHTGIIGPGLSMVQRCDRCVL